MGRMRRTVIEAAIIAGTGVFIYNNVLSDDTKSKIRNMKKTVVHAAGAIRNVVDSRKPMPPTEEENEANREAVERQWESIGY